MTGRRARMPEARSDEEWSLVRVWRADDSWILVLFESSAQSSARIYRDAAEQQTTLFAAGRALASGDAILRIFDGRGLATRAIIRGEQGQWHEDSASAYAERYEVRVDGTLEVRDKDGLKLTARPALLAEFTASARVGAGRFDGQDVIRLPEVVEQFSQELSRPRCGFEVGSARCARALGHHGAHAYSVGGRDFTWDPDVSDEEPQDRDPALAYRRLCPPNDPVQNLPDDEALVLAAQFLRDAPGSSMARTALSGAFARARIDPEKVLRGEG